MRNPWGEFIVWILVKFQDGLPKRWANKCLGRFSTASLDRGVKLPTSWGRGVYMTWAWSADCGCKPNGHTICYLLPKTINLLPPGQTLLLFSDSHRVRRSCILYRMKLAHRVFVIRHCVHNDFIQFGPFWFSISWRMSSLRLTPLSETLLCEIYFDNMIPSLNAMTEV